MDEPHSSPAYRRGVPLRGWGEEPHDVAGPVAAVMVQASGSTEAVRKLLAERELTAEEVIACGRLDFHCFLSGYEPMVALSGDPRLDLTAAQLLRRHSKHLA